MLHAYHRMVVIASLLLNVAQNLRTAMMLATTWKSIHWSFKVSSRTCFVAILISLLLLMAHTLYLIQYYAHAASSIVIIVLTYYYQ